MPAIALRARGLIFLTLLSAAGTQSIAAPVIYFGYLSGAAESPVNASPGSGFTLVTVDADAATMRVQVSFSGLTGGTTASHIHCCTTSAGSGSAGVATTVPSFANFPISVTSGSYDQTLDLTSTSSYNPAFVTNNGGTVANAQSTLIAGIAADKAYLNIHTSTFAGGEIRAFLIPDSIFRNGLEAP